MPLSVEKVKLNVKATARPCECHSHGHHLCVAAPTLDLTNDVHFTQEEADDAVHHGRGCDAAADERALRRHLDSGKGFDLHRSGKGKYKPLICTATITP